MTLLLTLAPQASKAFSLESEITTLNREYGRSLGYPIAVINKDQVLRYFKSVAPKGEDEQVQALKAYALKVHGVHMSDSEGLNILPYITRFKDTALALPFYDQDRIKSCYVLPNFSANNHSEDIRRILAQDSSTNIYAGFNFTKAEKWMAHEDLILFSLYHELSHCFDKVFMAEAHISGGDPHTIHQSEVFAEVNALFLMSQKKSKKKIGFGRALLRGTYSRYMGPFFARQPPSMAGDAYKKGGSVYFLAPALLKAQQLVESFNARVDKLSIQDTIALSLTVVRHHSISSRSFQALSVYFELGPQVAMERYRSMAQKNPELFMQTYTDLLSYDAFLRSLEIY